MASKAAEEGNLSKSLHGHGQHWSVRGTHGKVLRHHRGRNRGAKYGSGFGPWVKDVPFLRDILKDFWGWIRLDM